MTTLQLPFPNWKKQLKNSLNHLVEQKWINVGLRAKMAAIVFIGLAGLLTIFALLGISTTRQTTRQALSERLAMAHLTAANFDATFNHIESILVILADQAALRDPQASQEEKAAALRTGFEQIALFTDRIYLLDTAGRILASTAPSGQDIHWSQVPALHGPPQEWQFNLAIVPGSHSETVLAVPVTDAATGVPVGFLAALLDLTNPNIFPFKHSPDLGSTGTLDVVDDTGHVLISTDPERVMNEEQDSLLSALLVAGEPMVETCMGCSEEEYSEPSDQIMAFAPMSQAPWGVLIRQEADEVFAPVRRLTMQTLVLGLVALVGALGLVWVTTSSVVDPVQLLTEAAGRIASGDLTTPISCRRGDEIGELGQNFDAMRVQLKLSIDEIQAWNQELDARVHEGTRLALAAQLEAQRARDDLRAIIDGLSDELLVIGPDYRIQQMNKTAQQHCADGGDSMIGQHCYKLFHQGQRCQAPDCECPIPRRLAPGESVKVTHVHFCQATGQKRYVNIAASPMRDANGNITRIIELMRDVTDEKQMEESLVRRNQQLSLLNAVATTVNQSLDLEDILDRTLDEILRLTGIDVGAIFLQKEMVGNLELLAHRGLSEEAAQIAAGFGMLDGSCGGVREAGQIIVVPDVTRYRGRRAESLKREKLCTLVHVPLVAKGCRLGSICVGTKWQREFDTEEQELLTALGNEVAVAVENARLYAEVQRKEQMRGELLKKVITAQEEERKRIARELHDDTSQTLTALLYAAEEAMDMTELVEIKERLQSMHRLSCHTLDGVHKLIFDLRPTMLDHLGLVPALRWFAQSRLEPLHTRVTVEETSTPSGRLPAEIETSLFRVVQEAINNIARHAGARNVNIAFQVNDQAVTVTVEDDGLGFDVVETTLSPDARRGLGLHGMRERVELLGGEMEICTAPGFGTQLHICVPLNQRDTVYA